MADSKSRVWAEFVSRYYGDASFAEKVDADPTECLRTAGIPVPEGKEIKLIKDTDKTMHYIMPSSSVSGMSVDELEKSYAGECGNCGSGGGIGEHQCAGVCNCFGG